MNPDSEQPTLKEVALKAGVSRATVSRTLSGDTRVKPETRQRIERIVEELGYRANPIVGHLMAQLRKGQKESYKATLAIMSPLSTNQSQETPPQRKFIEGATARAKELGYSVEYFCVLDSGVSIARWKQILDARNIRGVLLTGFVLFQDLIQVFKPVWENRACVMIGARSVDPPWHFAANDFFASSVLVLKELARLGYRKPACIVDERVEVYLERRFTAAFLAGYPGIKTSPAMILRMNFIYTTHPPDVSYILAWVRRTRPDVIICGEHKMPEWLREGGIRVPEDMGVIRVDLHEDEPGYAGVNQNSALVGKSAVDLLIGQLHYGEFGTPSFQKCVMIEGRWVSGDTVRQM